MPHFSSGSGIHYWPPLWPQILNLFIAFVLTPAMCAIGYMTDDYFIIAVNTLLGLGNLFMFFKLRSSRKALRESYRKAGIHHVPG